MPFYYQQCLLRNRMLIEHVLCYRMSQYNVSLLKIVVNIVFFYFIFRVTMSGSYKINLETYKSRKWNIVK